MNNIKARFKILDAFYLKSTNRLVIVGDIIDGVVKRGMFFKLKESIFKISEITYVDNKVISKSKVGIVINPSEDHFLVDYIKSFEQLNLFSDEPQKNDGSVSNGVINKN